MSLFSIVFNILRAFLKSKKDMPAENLCLRQQVASLCRTNPRPKLTKRDRIFWVWMSKVWSKWESALSYAKPDTVKRWHRMGFKLYWNRKSRKGRPPGRPKTDPVLRRLIRQVSRANPYWGTPMIQKILALLGYPVSTATIWKYIDRSGKERSMTWRTFLRNHASQIAAIDFFTLATATFRILYGFVVLEHSTRRIIHFNVTANPTALWTAIQLTQAFPWDTAPRFILRDNDGTYGDFFSDRMDGMGIEEVTISPYSPWQNPYCERVIGTIRKDCLNHVIVLGERHFRRIISEYIEYYNATRPHGFLDGNCPTFKKPSEGLHFGFSTTLLTPRSQLLPLQNHHVSLRMEFSTATGNSARPDLCGGRRVTGVPTATTGARSIPIPTSALPS